MLNRRRTDPLASSKGFSLPLAPMADVFIVLLIFLLKTTSMNQDNSRQEVNVPLPSASGIAKEPSEMKIGISKDALSVNNRKIASLANFEVAEMDSQGKPDYHFLTDSLTKAIQLEHQSDTSVAAVTIYADKDAPFSTIQTILNIAAASGNSQLQIAVIGD